MSKLPETTYTKLRAKLARYELRIKEINTVLAHTIVTFEENKELRMFLRMYEDLAKETKKKMKTIEIKRRLEV